MGAFPRLLLPALIALLATAALVSSASAAEFHSEGENTTIQGTQVNIHVWKFTAGEVTCPKTTVSGTQTSKTASSITFTPTATECHINFFGSKVSATVNFNGCDYRVYASGLTDIVCPAGKTIVISSAGCTIEIGAQNGLKSVSFANTGGLRRIWHFIKNIAAIIYHHAGFTCGTGSGTTGTESGTTTVEGNKGGIWYE
jgi:hypothetical protein